MPRPIKRLLQRVHMIWRSRRPVTKEEASRAIFPSVKQNYSHVQQNVGTPSSNIATARAYQTISASKNRFALTRAFRAAGIFGNETRNEIIQALKQNITLEQKVKPEKARVFWRVYKDAQRAADYAEGAGVAKIEGERKYPTSGGQRPMHGNRGRVIQGDFSSKRKKTA